jgi:hypothetical protein
MAAFLIVLAAAGILLVLLIPPVFVTAIRQASCLGFVLGGGLLYSLIWVGMAVIAILRWGGI